MTIRLKAYAKLNLLLDITGIMPNGYHYLDNVTQSVDIGDIITVTAEKSNRFICKITCDNKDIPTDERNIVYKAAKKFSDRAGFDISCDIDIIKQVPLMGGMGGSSVDGAGTLFALNNLFGNVSQISSMVQFDWVVLFQLVVMFLMLRIVWVILSSVLDPEKSEPGRSKTVLHLLKSIFRYMIFLVGIFWSLSILGVNLATLFASVGILTLVIGFGAESLIADMITGLFMFFEHEYNVGDIIEVNGYRGKVTNIGIRTTSITDNGGNVKVVNNSDMRNIVNLSHENSFAICDFPSPHSADLEAAEKALEKVLADVQKQNDTIFAKKPEYVGVQYLDASQVVLRISAEVSEADRFDAARILNRALKLGMGKFAE